MYLHEKKKIKLEKKKNYYFFPCWMITGKKTWKYGMTESFPHLPFWADVEKKTFRII